MKVWTILFLAAFSLFYCCSQAFCEGQINADWPRDCQLLEQAIMMNERIKIDVWPADWMTKKTSLGEKSNMYRLWILGANRSYDDIMSCIYELMWTYDQKIFDDNSKDQRGKLLNEKIKVLLDIFQTLDQQIRDWRLNENAVSSSKLNDVMRIHAGSFYDQVGDEPADRNCLEYHKKETCQLKNILEILKSKKFVISKQDYYILYKKFTGKMRYYEGGE